MFKVNYISKNFVLSTIMKKILEIQNIYNFVLEFFKLSCIFAVYPIGVGYMATHRGKRGGLIKNLHINKT